MRAAVLMRRIYVSRPMGCKSRSDPTRAGKTPAWPGIANVPRRLFGTPDPAQASPDDPGGGASGGGTGRTRPTSHIT